MTYDVFAVCAQIRQDWADTRMDQAAGPSKKCPGGYSIPADKECSGAKDAMKQRYKTTGAAVGSFLGAPGSIVGSKIGGRIADRKLKKGAEPVQDESAMNASEWKTVRRGIQASSLLGGVAGAGAGLAATGIGTGKALIDRRRRLRSAGSSAKQPSPQ